MSTRRAAERDPAALVAAVVLVCALGTVAVTFLPFVQFAYRAFALHVTFETANALIALLLAYLVHGRYRSARRLQDLLLALALCTTATADLVLTALPTALAAGADGSTTDRAATVTRLIGVGLMAAAAAAPRRAVVRRRSPVPGVAVVVAPAVVWALLVVAASTALPAVEPPADGGLPLAPDSAFLGAQVLGGLLYLVAATALTVKTARSGDELLRWLAAACAVGVFARFHYVLHPSLYSEYVYSGDLLRLGSHVLLLVGAAREIRSYWGPAHPPSTIGSASRAATASSRPPA